MGPPLVQKARNALSGNHTGRGQPLSPFGQDRVNLHDMEGLLWGGAVLLALAAVSNFISAWFRRWTTEIAVTDRRVILKHGFIRRATMEMNLAKVESIDVDQTLTGRLFNYGNVTIRGTGSSNSPHDRRAAETADDGDHELTGRFCAQLDVARLA